jgi:hypothetical protein
MTLEIVLSAKVGAKPPSAYSTTPTARRQRLMVLQLAVQVANHEPRFTRGLVKLDRSIHPPDSTADRHFGEPEVDNSSG